ncbi:MULTISPECIES: NgoFVII family restriction endonuclease [Psychrilyobacter]|uniref:NgoFVII family restriction endonuclease n=1 Tax=Psychrilyobacter piezotolerans TaxID=2293438 RepID=A0ABX9KJI4_9FUSO|nr:MULTISPECIES: NgoFVII family restriction endonuclease [Psychrilyobacter]MCS5420296.1 hypothetical protein [Psychrilyobacter sp. S5]NDI77322.1 NgoFVII family restriction endonuclease [Psychrilyobacter piezotolerans]RDE63372.1 NgoFVII family restriction endonuclease [Psychrilyobacter sp. S5]REI41914.1 NgoFVII family restriction endonuclease [Psychrilyobacter piezotolerans]
MADIIWNKFLKEEKEEYIQYLEIFGALSGLFKDNKEGANARKPYLYYRNHEQLFTRIFSVDDLARKNSAFDALGTWKNDRVGIGLKTWMHTRDHTYQKVAEFNKLAPDFIAPLIEKGTPEQVIKKVSEFRNERIMLDKRLYKTDRDVYHYITRDDDIMNIVEAPYDLIDIDSLELIDTNGKTYNFKDKKNEYKFYRSKSVLQKKFDASKGEIIAQIKIEQFDDPFELIRMIELPKKNKETIFEEIYLPLYQDKKDGGIVSDCSGVNIRHAKSKNKGSNTPRPEYEIEIRISTWIHRVFPKFFGIDAFDSEAVKLSDFDLILPDGRVLRGRIKQQNGKSLQTNPQGALGEWILNDVLGLKNREVATMELLNELGIDSLKITKLDNEHFKITVAETGAYEKFKLDNIDNIDKAGLKGNQRPYIREDLVQELLSEDIEE